MILFINYLITGFQNHMEDLSVLFVFITFFYFGFKAERECFFMSKCIIE